MAENSSAGANTFGLKSSTIVPPKPEDGTEVTWENAQDNPYNWPTSRKVLTGILCSSSQLITTMSASMLVPALDQILDDLGVDAFSGQIAFSVFFLGLGFAPFIVAPLSEIYGRRPIWLAGNMFYILWNSLCPVGDAFPLMVIGRLMSASGASVGVTLTGPILADMYGAKDRGKAVAIAGILPYIGPALGPIIGGIAAQHLHWPWLFWILSICDAVCLVLGFLLIRETFGPVLLTRGPAASTLTQNIETNKRASPLREFLNRFIPAVKTQFRLLFFRPVIQLAAFALALQFGTYTLVLGSFATLWQSEYHQSSTDSSLHYISLAIGALLSAQVGGALMDYIWRRMKAKHADQNPTPEYRIPYFVIGILPAMTGLLLYAWASENHLHWVIVDIGVLIFTWTAFMSAGAMTAYLFDEFPQKLSASAGAAARVGSYVAGFAFPIFAPALYEALGYGWGNTLLALLFGTFCGLVASLLWFWGPQIRAFGRREHEFEQMRS